MRQIKIRKNMISFFLKTLVFVVVSLGFIANAYSAGKKQRPSVFANTYNDAGKIIVCTFEGAENRRALHISAAKTGISVPSDTDGCDEAEVKFYPRRFEVKLDGSYFWNYFLDYRGEHFCPDNSGRRCGRRLVPVRYIESEVYYNGKYFQLYVEVNGTVQIVNRPRR